MGFLIGQFIAKNYPKVFPSSLLLIIFIKTNIPLSKVVPYLLPLILIFCFIASWYFMSPLKTRVTFFTPHQLRGCHHFPGSKVQLEVYLNPLPFTNFLGFLNLNSPFSTRFNYFSLGTQFLVGPHYKVFSLYPPQVPQRYFPNIFVKPLAPLPVWMFAAHRKILSSAPLSLTMGGVSL